jgi:hypothetical protein
VFRSDGGTKDEFLLCCMNSSYRSSSSSSLMLLKPAILIPSVIICGSLIYIVSSRGNVSVKSILVVAAATTTYLIVRSTASGLVFWIYPVTFVTRSVADTLGVPGLRVVSDVFYKFTQNQVLDISKGAATLAGSLSASILLRSWDVGGLFFDAAINAWKFVIGKTTKKKNSNPDMKWKMIEYNEKEEESMRGDWIVVYSDNRNAVGV